MLADQLVAKIGEMRTVAKPKTTFTAGTVRGGTSVNAIAGDAKTQVDMRSNGTASLLALRKQVFASLPTAVPEETARWGAFAVGFLPLTRTPAAAERRRVVTADIRSPSTRRAYDKGEGEIRGRTTA